MEFSGQRPCCVLKLGVDLFTSVLHGRHFLPLAYHLFLSVLLLHFLNVFVLVPPADCSEVTFFEVCATLDCISSKDTQRSSDKTFLAFFVVKGHV